MKKRILSLTLAALMTAAVPFSASAELTNVQKSVKIGTSDNILISDSFAYGNVWLPEGWLKTNKSAADNFKSDGTYTWIESLKAGGNYAKSDVVNIFKTFPSIAVGETLEFETVVKPHKSNPTMEQGQHVTVQFENDDATKSFVLFKYDWAWVGSVNGKRYSFAIGDNEESLGPADELEIHDKDIKVKAVLKPNGSKYEASVYVTNANDGTEYLKAENIELAKQDVLAFSKINVKLSADWKVETRGDDDKILGIKSIKLAIPTTDSLLYADTGVRLNERLYNLNAETVKWLELGTDETKIANWNNGNTWKSDAVASWCKAFKSTDGYFWPQHHNVNAAGTGSLQKRFDGVKDGEKLKLSVDLKADDTRDADGSKQGMNFSLSLAGEEHKLNVITLRRSKTAGWFVGVGGLDANLNNCEPNSAVEAYSAHTDAELWNLNQYFVGKGALDEAKNYCLEMSLVPEGEDYKVYVVVKDAHTGDAVEKLTNTENPLTISKEIAESLNIVELRSFAHWGNTTADDTAFRTKPLGFRNLKIEVEESATSELVKGENKIYVPYEKVSNEPLTAVICAAVVNADGVQTDFDVVPLNEVIKNRDNVELTVNVTDADNDYVRVFVFDSLKGLTPLRSSMSTNGN